MTRVWMWALCAVNGLVLGANLSFAVTGALGGRWVAAAFNLFAAVVLMGSLWQLRGTWKATFRERP